MSDEHFTQSIIDDEQNRQMREPEPVLVAPSTAPTLGRSTLLRSTAANTTSTPSSGTLVVPVSQYDLQPYSSTGRVFFEYGKYTHVCSASANGKNIGTGSSAPQTPMRFTSTCADLVYR
jgi:hypothetical protein